jgi:hypothetical protein
MIYEVTSLIDARLFLRGIDQVVVLTNPQGSTRYYGMRVLDYIFRTLQMEFPSKIEKIIVNVYDDYAAFITAKKIGYKNIQCQIL